VKPSEVVSEKDQEFLLRLARNAIQTTVRHGRQLPIVHSLSGLLREKRGVFVTIWMEGELRGCVGFPYPAKPLVEAVQEAAISAALRDFRFPPVVVEEIPRIEIEISVLTAPKKTKPDQVKVGIHGLIISRGNQSGLLLPQVAMDHHWDSKTFLEQTCGKAGLPKNAWKENIELYAFEAQVFSEADLE
jgi:AmmeMemoRadiSam system protein A